MLMALPMLAVGAGLGLEGTVRLGHDQVHVSKHLGQHMVGLQQQALGLQLQLHMAVAQVVGGPHQVEGLAMLATDAHLDHRLCCRLHQDQRTILGYQHIAAAHHCAAREKHAQRAALAVGRVKAAFLAHVPVQFDAGSTLEQHGRQALALGDQFVDSQH
jgi:hypothetical protein